MLYGSVNVPLQKHITAHAHYFITLYITSLHQSWAPTIANLHAVPVFDQRSNVAYCRIARSGDVLAFYIFYKSPEQIIHVDIHGRIQNVSLGGGKIKHEMLNAGQLVNHLVNGWARVSYVTPYFLGTMLYNWRKWGRIGGKKVVGRIRMMINKKLHINSGSVSDFIVQWVIARYIRIFVEHEPSWRPTFCSNASLVRHVMLTRWVVVWKQFTCTGARMPCRSWPACMCWSKWWRYLQ